jgi:hypothetical protein
VFTDKGFAHDYVVLYTFVFMSQFGLFLCPSLSSSVSVSRCVPASGCVWPDGVQIKWPDPFARECNERVSCMIVVVYAHESSSSLFYKIIYKHILLLAIYIAVVYTREYIKNG